MGQELELDLNDKSSLGLSPDTVLPSQQYCLNVKKRYKNGKSTGEDDFLKLKEKNYADLKFGHFHSSSPKSLSCRSHGLEVNIEMTQGSMYQSSEQVINIKKMGTMRGRKKIEISSGSSDASFSGCVVDSLCGSDDESLYERPSVMSRDSNLGSPSPSVSGSSNGFIEFCINSDVWDENTCEVEGIDSINTKIRSDNVAGSLIDGNFPLQKDTVLELHESHSSMVEISHLQSPSESDCSTRSTRKVSPTSLRKRLNSFTKSKTLTSPVSCVQETTEVKLTGARNGTRSRTYQRSLLNDFSNIAKHSNIISEFINRDIQFSGLSCSPVHLHGNLKLKNKQGLPFFEFKVKCPEDVFVAKTWKSGNVYNYTFHSMNNRNKSTSTDFGSHYCDKDSSMVAQMQVSYDLCSKLDGGVFDNSMVTEFVLYDLTHSRKSVSPEKNSHSKQDCSKIPKASRVGVKSETSRPGEETLATKNKLLSGNADFDNSYSYPLSSTELHSKPEMAAIVLQIPFQKRESLKYKRKDRINAKAYSKLSNLSSAVQHSRKIGRKITEQVKVVLPNGSHGLPSAESQGPSSLIDRWKHGGGCDCGGWDMACPLILLGNPSIQFAEDHSLMEEYRTLKLFTQGAKERTATFGMTMVEEGQYAVDFHAQLSPLQAFSICIAMLHGTFTFSDAGHVKNQQISRCNSLKMLLEKEVELFINSVTKEENTNEKKIQKGVTLPYVLNPPFSPIARV